MYFFYRPFMRLLHRFDLHYAPAFLTWPSGSQRWCRWCGFRESYPYDVTKPIPTPTFEELYGAGEQHGAEGESRGR